MSGAPSAGSDPPGMRDSFGRLLRIGVAVSGVLLLAGLLLAAARGTTGLASGPGAAPLGSLLPDLAAGSAWPLLWLGVAALVATPIVRVLLALAEFARARDRAFVVITGFVIAVLFATAALGVAVG